MPELRITNTPMGLTMVSYRGYVNEESNLSE